MAAPPSALGGWRIDREHRIGRNDGRPNAKRLKRPGRRVVPDRARLAEPCDEGDETSACSGVERADPDRKKRGLPPKKARERDRKEKLQERAKSLVLQDPTPSEHDPVGTRGGFDEAKNPATPWAHGSRVGSTGGTGRESGDARIDFRSSGVDRVEDRFVAEIRHAVPADEENAKRSLSGQSV